jgi:hypothetical protein
MAASPDGPAATATVEQILSAVQAAEWSGAVSRAHASAIRAAIAPAAAPDGPPGAAAGPQAKVAYALAAPDPRLVALPISARLALRFGVQRAELLRQHIDSGKAGAQLLSAEGKFLAGLTCEDLYNLGYTKASLQLTRRVLLGSGRLGCWPLGQLAVCFGFTAAEMLRALGVERLDAAVPPPQLALLSKLLASQQSAQSYGAAGVSSEMLHGLGCDIGMLQTLPFGVKDIATYMGLTYTLARQMGLGAETCGTSGWSFVNVREALKLSEKQAQECGLTVARFLVLPGGR